MAKFTKIKALSIFGDEVEFDAEILDFVYHGFNTCGGGWGLYRVKPTDSPAEFVRFREKGKRKLSHLNVRDVININDLR